MKSYLVFLSRNKLYTLIELFGLSVALGFILLLASYARSEYTVGTRFSNAHQVYAIGCGNFYGMTLGTPEEFFPTVAEIDSWARLVDCEDQDVLVGSDYFSTYVRSVDARFFALFPYEVISGDPQQALLDEHNAVLTASFARKAFGTADPIGQTLRMGEQLYTVAAVVADGGPKDLLLPCDLYVNMRFVEPLLERMDNFGSTQAFVTLHEGADPAVVAKKLLKQYRTYWDYYREVGDGNTLLWGSTLTPTDEIYFSDFQIYNSYRQGDRAQVNLLLALALVLLLSALFNYINLTVALTGKRMKEMATRRLLGDSTQAVMGRYIAEALLFTLGCFGVGLAVAWLCVPFFNRMLSTEIHLLTDPLVGLVAVGLWIGISLVSGLISVSFLLRFKPLDVMKGAFRFQSKLVLSRVFIVVQCVISTCLMAMAGTMWLQFHHLATLPTGYQTADLIKIQTFSLGYRNHEWQQLLADRLRALPQVEAVGMGVSLPSSVGHYGVHEEGVESLSYLRYAQMDTTCFRLLGFQIVERYEELQAGKCWIDEDTQQHYGVNREHAYIGGTAATPEYPVCGIVRNYRSGTALWEFSEDSHNAIYILEPGKAALQLVKIRGDRSEAMQAVKAVCLQTTKELLGMPKELPATYIEDALNDALTGTRNTMLLVICFMVIATLISMLGLLAMSIYYTEQQRKRIAICRVMGASVRASLWQLSKGFLLMTLVAIGISMPLSVKAMQYYLQDFSYRIAFPWWILLAAALLSLVVAFLSIFGQALRTALRNPIESIRTE